MPGMSLKAKRGLFLGSGLSVESGRREKAAGEPPLEWEAQSRSQL
jgi:hypothetical protein